MESDIDMVILVMFFGFCLFYFEVVIKVDKYVFMEKLVVVDVFGVWCVLVVNEIVKERGCVVVVGL